MHYLILIYFCRKYATFTKFYEFMLQKVLKQSAKAYGVSWGGGSTVAVSTFIDL